MTRILNWLGLMRRSEHERLLMANGDAWASLVVRATNESVALKLLIESLRPDAQRWRDRQRRERERGQRRKGK